MTTTNPNDDLNCIAPLKECAECQCAFDPGYPQHTKKWELTRYCSQSCAATSRYTKGKTP